MLSLKPKNNPGEDSYRSLLFSYKKEIEAKEKLIQEMKKTASQQAEDEGLWFNSTTAPEAYLQQELRRLHAIIEKGEFKNEM